ncbi:MFS transporter [Glaciihabitans sp. dw_435]|uniref:MFS transporter n=1 Tax=Glaciihabitans sp. dw_435 TaxID=2720081 RepID=UPI0021069266|nr:MFS transporter [Glaciihabitans sp. dw_435]
MLSTSPPAHTPTPSSIFGRQLLPVTIGIIALVFLAAFEALAVTTVMPTISAALNGQSLYAVAFAGPLAIGVVGMVAAGNWSDRSGPVRVVLTAGALFIVGLVIAGTATSMQILVVGRLIHGLGGGAVSVALYVVVARIYPQQLHPRIFAAFSAAWLVPALVGPFIAGVVAQYFGWHWVFLGVAALVPVAVILLAPALRTIASGEQPGRPVVPWQLSRTAWSLAAAAAVLAASMSAQLTGALMWVCVVGSFVIAAVAVRPLLPAGTLTARPGLPVVIAVRGLISGAYMSAEVYLPYLLTGHFGLSPSLAGLALTTSGVTWAAASWAQGKYPHLLSDRGSMRLGSSLVVLAIVASALTSLWDLSPLVSILGWALAGGGMGMLAPRQSGRVLRLSSPEAQGFTSSALLIADSIGAALALAATGAVFAVLTSAGGTVAYTGSFILSALLGVSAFLVAGRVHDR